MVFSVIFSYVWILNYYYKVEWSGGVLLAGLQRRYRTNYVLCSAQGEKMAFIPGVFYELILFCELPFGGR